MTLLIIFILFILFLMAIAGYHNYQIIKKQPTYDPKNMALNYEITGSGEQQLVLLHGLTGSLNYWKHGMDNILTSHRLLLIDLLGFGDSPKPQSDYSLSVQLRAVEVILHKEGFSDGKTIIGGHSMGAVISLALLEKHPNWFKAGVFIGIPVYKDADELKKVMSTRSLWDRITANKWSKYLCMIHPVFMNRAFKPDNLTDDVFEDSIKHHWQSFYYSLNEVILNSDLFDIANEAKNKNVLFIHGKKDTTAPIENAIRLSEVFTNARFIISAEGDHHVFLEEPDFIWQNIQKMKLD